MLPVEAFCGEVKSGGTFGSSCRRYLVNCILIASMCIFKVLDVLELFCGACKSNVHKTTTKL